MQGQQQERLRSIGDVLVHVNAPGQVCPKCKTAMHVRKTVEHRGATLLHGPFRARETEYICPRGCTERNTDGRARRPVVRRPAEIASLLLPRSTTGYDVMVHVGVQRFVHFRQREAIRESLATRWGVKVSSGQVSVLARKFCVYLRALHCDRAKPLRKALEADGGWPMHLDATGEDGQGTLLVIYAGWRHWVLGSWKIPTENADAILPRMLETAQLFGPPCAVMRDLGRAVIGASTDYIDSLNRPIPNLGCHMHFVRDIGKDLLREPHDTLHALFRRFGIVGGLRAHVRELGRRLSGELDDARGEVLTWLNGDEHSYQLPEGRAGFAVVRALTQWTLDWTADGNDVGFPFDRPWLDLYRRCLKVCRVTETLLARQDLDSHVYRALWHLFSIVVTVRSQVPFGRHATVLAKRAKLLDELRSALRLELKADGRNTPRPRLLSSKAAARELQDIEAALKRLTRSLLKRRPNRGPAQDARVAIDVILAHIDRHGSSLFGHQIRVPRGLGGGIRIVERTNVLLESFFHAFKRGERRRSGRKNLGQDLEHLPPDALLAFNLRCQDYLDIVCDGSVDGLPAAFARLDAGHRDKSLPARVGAGNETREAVTSSMTTIDRRMIRTDAMNSRVDAAARSRSQLLS